MPDTKRGIEFHAVTQKDGPPTQAAYRHDKSDEKLTPPACSVLSRLLDEPLAGTAPVARFWIMLEQPGPWGRKALTQSHLDPALGAVLEAAAADHGARVALIRRPGPHPDDHRGGARRIWIASTRPNGSWLLGGQVANVGALEFLPWDGLAAGDYDAVREAVPGLEKDTEPLLLVCTNGRRDVCCASFGRPVVTAAQERLPDRVWETTHLGGHRFAPTCAVLPHGIVYGRMDTDAALHVLHEARDGRLVLAQYRGRSTFDGPGQVAEVAVREAASLTGLDELDVTAIEADDDGQSSRITIAHTDGRRWQVDVTTRLLEPPRPESCNGPAVQPVSYVADGVVLKSG
jgi:hypothetical protein